MVLGGTSWQDTVSFSLWVKPEGSGFCTVNDPAQCDSILGDRPRWWGLSHGTVNGLDRLWVWNYDGNYDKIGIPYTAGEWVHIAWVHSGGLLSVYKNGVLVDSILSGTTQQPSTGASPRIQVGAVINNTVRNWSFQGEIDELRFYNIALTQNDIQATMFSELSGSENGLRAYYKMSDGSGTLLTDDSINDFTGYLFDGGGIVPANGSYPLWVTSTVPLTNTLPTPTATATSTPLPSTATATPTATSTAVSSTATATPTNTAVPPTNTPLPPGNSTPTATSTSISATATATPTNTAVPPTNTPLPPSPTPTNTSVPSTPTATPPPTGGNPVETGFLVTSGAAYDLAVNGNIVYIADAWGGIKVVNVSNPALPVQLSAISTSGRVYGVATAGIYLYAANAQNGLLIYNVSDPVNPQLLSVLGFTRFCLGSDCAGQQGLPG